MHSFATFTGTSWRWWWNHVRVTGLVAIMS